MKSQPEQTLSNDSNETKMVVMAKLKVYVHSLEVPTVSFVDKEGAMHACAQAQKLLLKSSQALRGYSSGTVCLLMRKKDFLFRVEDFCKTYGLEYEIVDVGTIGFFARLKLKIRGLKTPAICCGEKTFHEVPSEEGLPELLTVI